MLRCQFKYVFSAFTDSLKTFSKIFLVVMLLYVRGNLISVNIPSYKVRRVCVAGLTSDAILLSCLRGFLSGLCGQMGPLLEYFVYRRLRNKLEGYSKGYDSIMTIPYSSIQRVRAMVKYGIIEVLIIETRDGIYELMAAGRYAKFGMHKFLGSLSRES